MTNQENISALLEGTPTGLLINGEWRDASDGGTWTTTVGGVKVGFIGGVTEELPALVARLMADAPASLGPMMVIVHGLETVAATRFEGRREYLRIRRAVIQADEGLRERDFERVLGAASS